MSSRFTAALVVSFALSNGLPAKADGRDGPRAGGNRGEGRIRVQPRFAAADPAVGPFPSDLFTVPDLTQNTGLRINLTPICEVLPALPSECVENGLLNELDGFHVEPRLNVAFTGPIDLSTVNSATIFLVKLGNTLANGSPPDYAAAIGEDGDEDDGRLPTGAGWVVGTDRGVWDPDTNTLFVKAEEILEQHTRYALIVTRGVLDTTGRPIEQSELKRFRGDDGEEGAVVIRLGLPIDTCGLRSQLRRSPQVTCRRGRRGERVLDHERLDHHGEATRRRRRAPSAQADFNGPNGARAVFDVAAITTLSFNRQTRSPGR
jgi:hypothetical protein